MGIWEYGTYERPPTEVSQKADGEVMAIVRSCGSQWFNGADWKDVSGQDAAVAALFDPNTCAYCNSPAMPKVITEPSESWISKRRETKVCTACGWWRAAVDIDTYTRIPVGGAYAGHRLRRTAWGCLKKLDVSDISVPLQELSQYLLARYDDRHLIHPKRFEDLVGGVFTDFGYKVRVTSYRGDDGIDVVALDGSVGDLVGIQVKRYRNKVESEQIRSLAGALMLGGYAKGVFVTTSSFTRGAEMTADRYRGLGHPIELMDASKFFDSLAITQRDKWDGGAEESLIPKTLWDEIQSIPIDRYSTFTY